MYVVPPPQRSDQESGSGDFRVYQAWKGSNVSFTSDFIFGYLLQQDLDAVLLSTCVAVFQSKITISFHLDNRHNKSLLKFSMN